jgi:hypothetical protein
MNSPTGRSPEFDSNLELGTAPAPARHIRPRRRETNTYSTAKIILMAKKPNFDSPEAFFLHGGVDLEQVYPQPTLAPEVDDPEHDAKYQSPYTIGDAAVDFILSVGGDPSDSQAKAQAERQIIESVPDAERIEQQRREVADKLSQLTRRKDG